MELTPNRHHSADGSYAHFRVGAFLMPVDRSTADLLTEGQGRHQVASLGQAKATFGEIEAITRQSGSPPRGPLARMVDDLPTGLARTIEPPLARARTRLADLVAALELPAAAPGKKQPAESIR